MGNKPVYAEDLNYWKSGQSSPDTWMEKTAKEIERAGGRVAAVRTVVTDSGAPIATGGIWRSENSFAAYDTKGRAA